jgi:DNA modification methylase
VLREVRRVLRPDGTLWLNLGDCYATGGGKAQRAGGGGQGDRWDKYGPRGYQGSGETGFQPNRMPQSGLKPKDLVGIPWRVAFALQDDGWWLRRDNVWHKPNPMPESTTDRCTSAHEYLFHLTKSARYFYDGEAIEECAKVKPHAPGTKNLSQIKGNRDPALEPDRVWANDGKRHKRSVWTIATSPYPEAHFATFPPALVEPCILAGTSAKGVCPCCGAPWQRIVRKGDPVGRRDKGSVDQFVDLNDGRAGQRPVTTIGWRASCDCAAGGKYTDPIPATVLDPFLGAGTTALVAERLGRDCIGIELSPAYAAMAERRTATGISPDVGASASRARAPAKLRPAA